MDLSLFLTNGQEEIYITFLWFVNNWDKSALAKFRMYMFSAWYFSRRQSLGLAACSFNSACRSLHLSSAQDGWHWQRPGCQRRHFPSSRLQLIHLPWEQVCEPTPKWRQTIEEISIKRGGNLSYIRVFCVFVVALRVKYNFSSYCIR